MVTLLYVFSKRGGEFILLESFKYVHTLKKVLPKQGVNWCCTLKSCNVKIYVNASRNVFVTFFRCILNGRFISPSPQSGPVPFYPNTITAAIRPSPFQVHTFLNGRQRTSKIRHSERCL
jgi:hypothetical protein